MVMVRAYGWQVRIVRHRKAMIELMRDRGFELVMTFIERSVAEPFPRLPWYRRILGDEWQPALWIDEHAFSKEEIRQIESAFPESDIDYEHDLKSFQWKNLIDQSEWGIQSGRPVEQRPGIIEAPWLHAGIGTCDDKIYVTRSAEGRLYLFKTAITPGRPREVGGYIYSTVPFERLGTPNADGCIRIEVAALDPGSSDAKAGATAIDLRAKPARIESWLSVSTCDGERR